MSYDLLMAKLACSHIFTFNMEVNKCFLLAVFYIGTVFVMGKENNFKLLIRKSKRGKLHAHLSAAFARHHINSYHITLDNYHDKRSGVTIVPKLC